MRISDWSSDVCSSDLADRLEGETDRPQRAPHPVERLHRARCRLAGEGEGQAPDPQDRSLQHIDRKEAPQRPARTETAAQACVRVLLDLQVGAGRVARKARDRAGVRRVGKEGGRTCKYRWT